MATKHLQYIAEGLRWKLRKDQICSTLYSVMVRGKTLSNKAIMFAVPFIEVCIAKSKQ
jgi:hypothetical protein